MAIFSLQEVKTEQVKNVANNNFESWPESATYGYYGGGQPPLTCTISRLDFSNETVSDPGKNLPVALSSAGGVQSNVYGYFGGGELPNVISTVTRLDFSTENVSDPGNNLPSGIFYSAVISNNSYGYFAGGKLVPPASSGNQTSAITRLDFSNETVSDPGQNLPASRWRSSAISSGSYGYFGLGSNPPTTGVVSTILRLDFSNETVSAPGKNLPFSSDAGHAVFNISYGYFSGGDTPGAGTSSIARLDFSNESTIDTGKKLPSVLMAGTPVQSSSFGYIGGGYKDGFRSSFVRTDFSTETITLISSKLPSAKERISSVFGGASVYRNARGFGTYGYFGGGYSGSPSPAPLSKSFVFRFDFSTEQFTPIGNLPSVKYDISGFSNKDSGYFLGGQFTPGVNYTAGSNKISFSNETISSSTSTGNVRAGSIGLNSKYCGYLVGGSPAATWDNNVTKFDYSTESIRSLGDILPSSIALLQAGVDCGSYGYMTLPFSCTINRLDFSNETISNPGNNIPQAGSGIKGISHTAYGYFAGGSNPGGDPATYYNTFIRLDFSSETTSLPGKNLPSVRRHIATTQSSSYGYCVGGEKPDYPPPPVLNTSEISTISRIDFSTEDVTNIATNFPQNISNSSGISNHNKYNL